MPIATVLLVDDDLGLVQMLKANLQAEGHNVITAYDGQMAIQLARMRKPNLIIMDVNMPMINGLRALEFLRRSQETARIPVLLLSGEKSSSIYPIIESVQRVTFVKKPIDLENLNS